MIRNLRKVLSTSITASAATRSARLAVPKFPVYTQQKATLIYTPPTKKDDRYLADDEQYDIPPARIVDNTLVYASNIIERPPLVHTPPPQWEVDYYKYVVAKESQEAKVLPKDLAETMYGKWIEPDEHIPDPLPLITEDDKANNRKSLYRALDQPLYLIVKVKQEIDPKLPQEIWCFPTTEVREGENVRTAAERTVFYHIGEVSTYTLGNAPILHTEYPTVPAETKKKYPSVKKIQVCYILSCRNCLLT